MPHLKHHKRGQDHYYSGQSQGIDVKLAVTDHGYGLSLKGNVRFEALSDKQAVGFRTFIHNAIDEALRTAATQRHMNVPLFELTDTGQPTHPQGVNEL
jgi:hypothetical protein